MPSKPAPDDSEPERRSSDEHTRSIVHMTVSEIFDGVGIDFSTPKGRQELRDDIAFLRDARAGTRLVRRTFWGGVVATAGAVLYKFGAAILVWAQRS